jgi:hypothetical protein
VYRAQPRGPLHPFLTFLALTAACATAQHGPTPLGKRASFDLNCPVDRLTSVNLDRQTVGVRGCGKRTVYVELCGAYHSRCQWLRQGEIQDDESRPQDDDPPRSPR